MENSTSVKHYKGPNDYAQSLKARSEVNKRPSSKNLKSASKEVEKVDISDKAKNLKDTIKHDISEISDASSHLAKDGLTALAKSATSILPLPSPEVEIGPGLKEAKKIDKIDKEIKAPVNKPGIFVISGLELLSSSDSDSEGLPAIAQAITGAQSFSWKDEDQVFEEIISRTPEQPIVLIGHSLGGDSAVSLANRLNTLKGGFRKVNLLVTLDSVGFNNDIIPQNVQKNLNFITDNDLLFNDGPNIARNSKKTIVENILSTESHTSMDEASEVQSEILENVQNIMDEFKTTKKFQRLASLYKDFIATEKNT